MTQTKAQMLYAGNLEDTTKSGYKSSVEGPVGYATVLTGCGRTPYPVTEDKLIEWVSVVAGIIDHETINTYMNGIAYYIEQDQLQSHESWIQARTGRTFKRVLKTIGQKYGKGEPQEKEALTTEKLHALCDKLDRSKHNPRAWWAIACLGAYTGLRGGEIVKTKSTKGPKVLTRGDLTWLPDREGGALLLKSSKTKKGVRNNRRKFPKLVDDPTCPSKALSHYLEAFPESLPAGQEQPLFVCAGGEPITSAMFVDWTNDLLVEHGLRDHELELNIKMLRAGAVTSGIDSGVAMPIARSMFGFAKDSMTITHYHSGSRKSAGNAAARMSAYGAKLAGSRSGVVRVGLPSTEPPTRKRARSTSMSAPALPAKVPILGTGSEDELGRGKRMRWKKQR